MKGILVFTLLIEVGIETQAKVFNSIAAMELIMETQARVIRSIETYLTEQKQIIVLIENYIAYNMKKLKKAETDPNYLWNPINAYSLMNSVITDFSYIRNIERKGYITDKSLLYPCMDDLTKSAQAIARLQTIYQLNITELANGTLISNFSSNNNLYVEHVKPMTSDDCYHMGLVSNEIQGFSGQLLWMKEALRQYHAERCNVYCPVKEVDIVLKISEGYEYLKKYRTALEWLQRMRALLPAGEHRDLDKRAQQLLTKVDNGEGHKTREQQKQAWKQPTFHNLFGCYEDLKQSTRKLNLLKCSYDRTSPFRKNGLLKVEYLAVAPTVVIYHDVISDAEIEALKDIAIPRLRDVAVINAKDNKPKTSQYRTGMGAGLDRNWPLVARLIQRIEDITDVNTTDTKIQVVNYRVGDSFSRHVDYFVGDVPDNSRGNRYMSFMYFLSNVEQGGALSFPLLGLKIYPKKGAAVAWTVLHPSGEGDLAMVHAACPVLRGSRWVAVHWSFERDQSDCPIWYHRNKIMTEEHYSQWHREYKEEKKRRSFRSLRGENNVSYT